MRVKSLVSIFVIALMVFGLSLSLGTQDAKAQGATVIMDFGCLIVPADWGGPGILFSLKSQAVETPSGNSKLTCQFDIPAGLEPATAQLFSGFVCGTTFGLTTESSSTVTPGGKVRLTCLINPN